MCPRFWTGRGRAGSPQSPRWTHRGERNEHPGIPVARPEKRGLRGPASPPRPSQPGLWTKRRPQRWVRDVATAAAEEACIWAMTLQRLSSGARRRFAGLCTAAVMTAAVTFLLRNWRRPDPARRRLWRPGYRFRRRGCPGGTAERRPGRLKVKPGVQARRKRVPKQKFGPLLHGAVPWLSWGQAAQVGALGALSGKHPALLSLTSCDPGQRHNRRGTPHPSPCLRLLQKQAKRPRARRVSSTAGDSEN